LRFPCQLSHVISTYLVVINELFVTFLADTHLLFVICFNRWKSIKSSLEAVRLLQPYLSSNNHIEIFCDSWFLPIFWLLVSCFFTFVADTDLLNVIYFNRWTTIQGSLEVCSIINRTTTLFCLSSVFWWVPFYKCECLNERLSILFI
jgi:hypothetical protein